MSTPANRHPGVGRAGTSAEYAARIPAIRADIRRLRAQLADPPDGIPPLVLRTHLLDALRRLHWYETRARVGTRIRHDRDCVPRSLNRVGRPRKRANRALDQPRTA